VKGVADGGAGVCFVFRQAGAPGCTLPPLKAATVALAAQSVQLMFGICAENQAAGVKALKAWTQALGLPKVSNAHGAERSVCFCQPR
jgi:hypothetical protein